METSHIREQVPKTVAHTLLLQVIHVELKIVLKPVVKLLYDFGLRLFDLQVGEEVCGGLEGINY